MEQLIRSPERRTFIPVIDLCPGGNTGNERVRRFQACFKTEKVKVDVHVAPRKIAKTP